MSKHTHGPWEVAGQYVRTKRQDTPHQSGHDGVSIADTYSPVIPHEEAKANALLIAAAPDLLSAIKVAFECLPEPPEACCSCHIALPCGDCVENGPAREAFEMMRAAIAKAEGRS